MTGDYLDEMRRSARSLVLIRRIREQAEALYDLDAVLFEAVHGQPWWAFVQHLDGLEAEAIRARQWLAAYVHEDTEAVEVVQ